MKHLGSRIAFIAGTVALVIILAPGAALAQEKMELPADAEMEMTPQPEAEAMPSLKELFAAEAEMDEGAFEAAAEVAAARVTYRVHKWQRGSTLYIPVSTVAALCGDGDGCSLRMGMYNWDNTGRVASRGSLFYYNPGNRVWRAERGDWAGRDYDGVIQHVMQAWACYFTDGIYLNWKGQGDPNPGFGLLSWNQYVAGCWLTIID